MAINLSETSRKYLVCFVLVILTLAVFWQVVHFDFVNLDDTVYVTKNSHIQQGLSLDGMRWALTTVYASFWHPLTWLSLMIDYQFHGLNPGGYHLTSLVLHVMNTLLLLWLFHRMTGEFWRSAFVASLFALHPLHVESVVWVAARKDTLSTFFWMMTLCTYVGYTEKPATHRYLIALACFAFGLMAKPMLVTLPFVLLLLDYWPLKRFQQRDTAPNPAPLPHAADLEESSGKRKGGKSKKKTLEKVIAPPKVSRPVRNEPSGPVWWRLVQEKIPFFALSIAFSVVAFYAQHQKSYITFPLGSRVSNAVVAYVVYIKKTLWPDNLAVFYPFWDALPGWQVLGAAIIIVLISVAVLFAAKRFPFLPFGWFWYMGILVPVIGVVQVGQHALADRYTYIPLIGLFVMAAWGAPELLKQWRHEKTVLTVAGTLIVAGMAVVTWNQAGHWRDSISLFRHALAVTKNNHLAHNNLGVALSAAGDANGAAFHYLEAIRLKPRDSNAHYNYANYLKAHDRIEEAISHYTEAIRLEPGYFNARNNLAVALASRGELREADFHYREALRLRPDAAGVHYNLAAVLANQGDIQGAEQQLREAIRIEPDFAEAHNNLGMMLAMRGKTEEGILEFREALRLKPNHAAANRNLSLALEHQRRKR